MEGVRAFEGRGDGPEARTRDPYHYGGIHPTKPRFLKEQELILLMVSPGCSGDRGIPLHARDMGHAPRGTKARDSDALERRGTCWSLFWCRNLTGCGVI